MMHTTPAGRRAGTPRNANPKTATSCPGGKNAHHRTGCGKYPTVTEALAFAVPVAAVATIVSMIIG
jgi:hypothetical protein